MKGEFFLHIIYDKMRENGLELHQWRSRSDITKNFFTERVTKLEQGSVGIP